MPESFQVDTYSHNFAVSGFDRKGRDALIQFAMDFAEYDIVRRWTGEYDSVLKRFYAAATKERTEFRFNINSLPKFFDYMERVGFPKYNMRVEDHPYKDPVRIDVEMKDHVVLRDYQVPLVDYMVQPGCNKVVTLQTGKGKAQPHDSLVKIPGGWKTMGEMTVGDKVICRDGSTANVVGVYPQGKKGIYRVTFFDGRTVECCGDHLWRIYRSNLTKGTDIVDTHEMIRVLGLSNNRLHIDLCEPEQDEDVHLPMDPYTLGVLLGDGCLSQGSVHLTNQNPSIIDDIRKMLPDDMRITQSTYNEYSLVGTNGVNRYKRILAELGLMGKKAEGKFVPEIYKNASSRQRMALLQGLMDTDGTAEKSGSVVYCTVSEQLMEDVRYLVWSLGGMASLYSKTPKYTYKEETRTGQLAYISNIRMRKPSSIFRLPKKQIRAKNWNQYSNGLKLRVDSIEYVGEKEATCIAIDHPEHLYITNGFVVTHNTLTALAAMVELGLRTVIAIRGMYVDRWLMDLTGPNSAIKTKKGDVMVVRGTKDLRNLIDLAIDDELEAKIIIITNKTLYTFFEHYERWPEDRVMYGCSPIELYDVLGAGLRIIDEVHQDFHLNFRQDLYTNIHKTISLSATLESDSPVINRMYEVMFPLGMRVDKGEYHKYISVHAIMYRLHDPYRIRHTQRGRNSYSHVAFEEFIMERKQMLRNYLDMIETCVWKYFTGIDDRKPGQRMLVFAATVEMCEKITKYLREKYADLSINKYTSEDEYEVLLNSDITVSTLLSAGTAVDVPGLRVCLVTTAIGSTQANLQALGRLRELKDFPGVTPLFLYFTCTDIDAHMRYHERKLERFEGKVICHKIVEMGLKL